MRTGTGTRAWEIALRGLDDVVDEDLRAVVLAVLDVAYYRGTREPQYARQVVDELEERVRAIREVRTL